jgi:hypothetical protein
MPADDAGSRRVAVCMKGAAALVGNSSDVSPGDGGGSSAAEALVDRQLDFAVDLEGSVVARMPSGEPLDNRRSLKINWKGLPGAYIGLIPPAQVRSAALSMSESAANLFGLPWRGYARSYGRYAGTS